MRVRQLILIGDRSTLGRAVAMSVEMHATPLEKLLRNFLVNAKNSGPELSTRGALAASSSAIATVRIYAFNSMILLRIILAVEANARSVCKALRWNAQASANQAPPANLTAALDK